MKGTLVKADSLNENMVKHQSHNWIEIKQGHPLVFLAAQGGGPQVPHFNTSALENLTSFSITSLPIEQWFLNFIKLWTGTIFISLFTAH